MIVGAYLVPHPPIIIKGIGRGDEIPDTRHAYQVVAAEIAGKKPDTVVIVSPHSVMYRDRFLVAGGTGATGDFSAFGVGMAGGGISIDYDEDFADLICKIAERRGVPSVQDNEAILDHGVTVPLYFIRAAVPYARFVKISPSGLPLATHFRLGGCITLAAARERRVVVVASGDMSHKLKADGPYGFAKEGPEFDRLAKECCETADFQRLLDLDHGFREKAGECGLAGMAVMAGALDGLDAKGRVLSYECPFGVGYLVASFTTDPYVWLARANVESVVRTGESIAQLPDLPKQMLSRQAGVFVTIKKDGQLRGCIGTIGPTQENVAEEIISNSVLAALKDPRFDPVDPSELDSLTYDVDVLSPSEVVVDEQLLDPKRYGVIVSCDGRRGLLLPDLDGVNTADDQIDIALKKGGISKAEPYSLERFEVTRHV
ncbi:MAG: AmmeMemoRadiSam system protein A [Synergistaceae bacterium]|jgi:AmmeMemoRadiSam system protein A/AmmeMemoRadiSam system protein B|nr:AmmeMemoRadiSam system protein A [Synergistaceae bacterium]